MGCLENTLFNTNTFFSSWEKFKELVQWVSKVLQFEQVKCQLNV